MRKLSNEFISDLQNGILFPILERVKIDSTLMLSIRNGYINIYYRGGNILKIEEQNSGSYTSFFDEKYAGSERKIPNLPSKINSDDQAKEWVNVFPHLKEIMDIHFSEKPKPEREFQQLVARENNSSTISNESEYFISDIEFTDTGGPRFDMLAIRWLANQRKNGNNCRAALIEMKYGDNALGGTSGLIKHLDDIDKFISNGSSSLYEIMENQFDQLNQLGLLKFNPSKNGTNVKIDMKSKPEVIFILANHNPRSTKLKTILSNPEVLAYSQAKHFDLKIYVASFAGYGLHQKCLLSLDEFLKIL